jgi:hypothetical protein
MMAIRELPEEMLSRFAKPELGREAALVACSPSAGIIGLAQYVADETGTGCEVAVVVDDAWQRQGMGYALSTGSFASLHTQASLTHSPTFSPIITPCAAWPPNWDAGFAPTGSLPSWCK